MSRLNGDGQACVALAQGDGRSIPCVSQAFALYGCTSRLDKQTVLAAALLPLSQAGAASLEGRVQCFHMTHTKVQRHQVEERALCVLRGFV